MELRQIWTVIVRRWWLILLPIVVAFIITIPSLTRLFSTQASYSVGIRFTAGQAPSGDATKTYQDQSYTPWLASEYVVNSLAAWVRTDSFATEVAKQLKTPNVTFDSAAIRNAIASDNARSIMTLYISWPQNEDITLIAQAAITVLQTKSQVYFGPELGTQPVQVIPLDSIIVNPMPPALAIRLEPLFRILIGFIAGIALAFLVEYLDPTLRSRQEVEALDLVVIAEIPKHAVLSKSNNE